MAEAVKMNKEQGFLSPADNLDYICQMVSQLRLLAMNAGAADLGHILEVASLEAELQLKLNRSIERDKSRLN